MPNFSAVGHPAITADITVVNGQVRACLLLIQTQVNDRVVLSNEGVVRHAAAGVGGILIMRQNLSRGQHGMIESKLVNSAKVRIIACTAGVIVSTQAQSRVSV